MIGCSKEYGMGVQYRNLELRGCSRGFYFWKFIMKKELLLAILQRILEEIEQWEMNESIYASWYARCIKDIAFLRWLNPEDYWTEK